jgi:hypothetical protein
MRFSLHGIAIVLALAVPAASAAPAAGLSFVQATVIAPDPATGTLSFVDASGRSRSHTVAGTAAARVSRLRPGEEVIVVLTGEDPVVQDVRASHATPAAAPTPAPDASADASDPSAWVLEPAQTLRPTWPNPYSRYYKGPRPAPKARR